MFLGSPTAAQVETISLLAGAVEPEPSRSGLPVVETTLVVAPMSLLAQWKEEVLRHTTFTPAQVLLHYGSDRAPLAPSVLRGVRVLLTTYGVVSTEFSRGTGAGLFSVEFLRIVLDEAHFVKNRLALVAKACCALEAQRRWVLSGTPVQNRISDVFSLLKFLRAEPLCYISHWNARVERVFNADPAAGLAALQGELAPLLLRRTKETRGRDGQPILTLPSSHVDTLVLDFDPAERDFYDVRF